MRVERDDTLLLQDILDYIESANRFLQGLSYDEFVTDQEKSDAAMKCFTVFREAALRLGDPVRNDLPHWRNVKRIGKKGMYEYWKPQHETVWKAIQYDLPTIRSEVQNLLLRMETSLVSDP